MIYYCERTLTAEIGDIEQIDSQSVAAPFLVPTLFSLLHARHEARPAPGAAAETAGTAEPA
jgi:hypothetical protein